MSPTYLTITLILLFLVLGLVVSEWLVRGRSRSRDDDPTTTG